MNKWVCLVFVTVLFTLFFLYLYTSSYLEIIYRFLTDVSFRDNFSLAESDIYVHYSLWDVIVYLNAQSMTSFATTMIQSTSIIQISLPLLLILSSVNEYNYSHSIAQLTIQKAKRYRMYMLKHFHQQAFKFALAFFSAYMVFFTFALIGSNSFNTEGVQRLFLTDIFGSNFYTSYHVLYFIIEGFIRFFITPYIYTFFACSLVLVIDGKKWAVLSPILYYFGVSTIMYGLGTMNGNWAKYFTPTSILLAGSFEHIHSLLLMFTSMIPLYIALIIIYMRGTNAEI